jgi:hypothetical protein
MTEGPSEVYFLLLYLDSAAGDAWELRGLMLARDAGGMYSRIGSFGGYAAEEWEPEGNVLHFLRKAGNQLITII